MRDRNTSCCLAIKKKNIYTSKHFTPGRGSSKDFDRGKPPMVWLPIPYCRANFGQNHTLL